MRLTLVALIFLFGLFDLFMGLNFLFAPASAATGFGLQPAGSHGLSTLRADFTAFFVVVAASMMIGAWYRKGDLLLVAAALMGIAVLARALSLLVDGGYPGWPVPMGVELAHVALLAFAWRILPKARKRS
jgi:hypothetical protein